MWKEQRYTDIGSALLKRIAREEVVTVPGLGSMLLPGKVGFAEDNSWRFNPATCRRWRSISPALARRGPRCAKPINVYCWKPPERLSPDWVRYEKDKGWQLKAEKTLISSYDAIRVYMW